MDKLTSMKIFVYVVEQGSFRSAANHFNLSATMISKHVHHLETSLNSQLIHRTTRKQSLTDSGQLYYRECKRILEDISNAENLIQTLENQPQGTVKINCPVTYGNKVLAPIVAKFLANHPTINVELVLNNDLVDPYSSDIDLIVRIGDLSDSSLVARYLGITRCVTAQLQSTLVNMLRFVYWKISRSIHRLASAIAVVVM